MRDNNAWYISIPAIAIAACTFWPVALVLLYLRWCRLHGKYKANNYILLIAGSGLIMFGMVGMMSFFDSGDMVDFMLASCLFLLPGGICAYFWYKRHQQLKGYQKYLDYIKIRKQIKIDQLCNKLNVGYDTAINMLTEMINKGLIQGYIENDELFLDSVGRSIPFTMESNDYNSKKETKVIKCKECGAKNTVVVGKKAECEYCGTILQ